MCEQFAELVATGLNELGLSATVTGGDALYFSENGKQIFKWKHFWVRVGNEIIDANTDIIAENPAVPRGVNALPYWGPAKDVPSTRKLRGDPLVAVRSPDSDLGEFWIPDLKSWLTSNKPK